MTHVHDAGAPSTGDAVPTAAGDAGGVVDAATSAPELEECGVVPGMSAPTLHKQHASFDQLLRLQSGMRASS
jgi:hypothetical protein